MWAIGHKKGEDIYLCSPIYWTEQDAVQRIRQFSSMDRCNTYVLVEMGDIKTAEYKDGKKKIMI